MKNNKKPPVRLEDQERVQAVRVMPLVKTPVIPRTTGYGYVQAYRTWQAIPEVSGQVVYLDEKIKKGYFVKKGEVLLRIDTRAYGLAESRGVAEVMSLDAQLKELEQSRKNTERLLTIEKKALAIAVQELERKRKLFEKQYISASDLEKEETNVLGRQTTVNNLQNTLKLIPAQKRALLAQKSSGESSVAERRLDVSKTEIRAPFNGRVSRVNIERFQFAPAGTVLLEAESIDRAEVPVQLSPREFFKLLPRHYTTPIQQIPDIETIRRAIGISAKVRLPLNEDTTIEWKGQFSRTGESIDPATGTLTFFVTVENPYGNLIPGKRPPLATNMYVQVELAGRPIKDRFVIPRSAVHGDKLYICTEDNRLDIRRVKLEMTMGDLAVMTPGVTGGVKEGETLVLSDLVPAIAGMKLLPEEDTRKAEQVRARATGEAI
jgi:multidrug efflux pump subunit AcrA (membrane-fusion protein)